SHGGAGRRHHGERRRRPAPARSSRCDRAGAPGHDLSIHSRQRDDLWADRLVPAARGDMIEQLGMVGVALLAGALRVSTPFLFVSLGECLTEKSGRINLGNEGALVLGAMSAYAASHLTGSPWLGVLVAAICGGLLGALHAGLCSLTRINDIAMGIAIMLAGTGLAFFFGK